MLKEKKQFNIKYAAFFFAFLLLYAFLIVRRCALPQVENVTYLFHCVDFSMGFFSRLLLGGIYNLLVGSPSQLSAAIYETVLLLLGAAGIAVLLSRFMASVPDTDKKTAFCLIAFFLTGSCTFAPYWYEIGMLDVSWIYISLIYISALRSKYIKWVLCPVLLFAACMVHPGAIITYVPFLSLLTLYVFAKETDKKEKLRKGIVFLLCVSTALGSFMYFTVNDKKNVNVSLTEFSGILEERGAEMTRYFEEILFCTPENYTQEYYDMQVTNGDYTGSPLTPVFSGEHLPALASLGNAIAYQLQYQLYLMKTGSIIKDVIIEAAVLLLILLPLLILFYIFAVKKFRGAKGNALLRITYFCFLFMFPLAAFCSLFISTDSVRWIAHGFLCLFTLTLYVLHDNKEDWSIIKNYFSGFSPVIGTAYFFIYALTILDPYV